MSDLTLEKEFEQAKRNHIINVCCSALDSQLRYEIDHSTGVNVPSFLLKDQIKAEVIERVGKAVINGQIESMYADAWEQIKENLA